MKENPYSPSQPQDGDSAFNRFRWPTMMAFLSTVIGIAMIGMAISSFAGSLSAMSITKGQISLYLLAATLLVTMCGLASICSAVLYFKRRTRPGAALLVSSLALFVIGPRLLAMVVPL